MAAAVFFGGVLHGAPAAAQTNSGPVIFYGGRIIPNAQVEVVYYGSSWTSSALTKWDDGLLNLADYISGVSAPENSGCCQPALKQFGITGASVFFNPQIGSPTKLLTEPQVQSIVSHSAPAAGYPNPNLLILVVFGPGFKPNNCKVAGHDSHCDNTVWWARHDSIVLDENYAYVFVDTQTPLPGAAHEVIEAITDPAYSEGSQYAGWLASTGAEIVDETDCIFSTNQFSYTDQIFPAVALPGTKDNTQNGACSTTGYTGTLTGNLATLLVGDLGEPSGWPHLADVLTVNYGPANANGFAINAPYINVLSSNGAEFTYAQWWSGLFLGSKGTYIADVDGDGYGDLVGVGDNYIGVLPSRGTVNGFRAYQTWKSNFPFFGSHGTFMADVDGDGYADAIGVGDNFIGVLRSTGVAFGGYETWKSNFPFFGTHGTFFADVDGDGKADAIAVGDTGIGVMRSTGSAFGAFEWWNNFPFVGTYGTFFADVDGDHKADAVRIGSNFIEVMRSTGLKFGTDETWKSNFVFNGARGNFLADVDGDGKADIIGAGPNYIGVLRSTGSMFGAYETWYGAGF